MNYNYSESTVVETSDVVSSKVAVSPQDDVVYYATQSGELVQADANTLQTIWSIGLEGAPVEADIVLNPEGTMLYVADAIGFVRGIKVAISDDTDPPAATEPPTEPSTADGTTAAPSDIQTTVTPELEGSAGAMSTNDDPKVPSTTTDTNGESPLAQTRPPKPQDDSTTTGSTGSTAAALISTTGLNTQALLILGCFFFFFEL